MFVMGSLTEREREVGSVCKMVVDEIILYYARINI